MMLSNRFQTIGNQLFLHLQMRAKRALFLSFWLLLLKLWLLPENLAILATFCNGGNFGYFVSKRCSLRSHCQNLGKIQNLFLVKLGQFSVITKKIVLWHLILWWKPISHLLKRKKKLDWKQLLFFPPIPRFSYFGWSNKGKRGKTLIPLDLRSTRWNFLFAPEVLPLQIGFNLWYIAVVSSWPKMFPP